MKHYEVGSLIVLIIFLGTIVVCEYFSDDPDEDLMEIWNEYY